MRIACVNSLILEAKEGPSSSSISRYTFPASSAASKAISSSRLFSSSVNRLSFASGRTFCSGAESVSSSVLSVISPVFSFDVSSAIPPVFSFDISSVFSPSIVSLCNASCIFPSSLLLFSLLPSPTSLSIILINIYMQMITHKVPASITRCLAYGFPENSLIFLLTFLPAFFITAIKISVLSFIFPYDQPPVLFSLFIPPPAPFSLSATVQPSASLLPLSYNISRSSPDSLFVFHHASYSSPS